MSAETLAATRRQWEMFFADDIPGVLSFLDPEVEIRDDPQVPDAAVYRGPDGYLAQIEKWRDAFDDLHWDPVDFIDHGEKVMSEVRLGGVAKSSGIRGEFTYFEVVTWSNGRVARVEYFLSGDRALAAMGLA